MRVKIWIVLGVCGSFLVGCGQGDDRLKEKARLEGTETAEAQIQAQIDNIDKLKELAREEGKANAEAELHAQLDSLDLLKQRAKEEGRASVEAEIEVQYANLAVRAREMEADLALRQRFYQAVKGTYEGDLATEAGSFKVRFNLVPSLPPYVIERTRQLEEIVADINNLYLNVQVVQWNPKNTLSAVGCRFQQIRPDLSKGELNLNSENCPNFYQLRLLDTLSGMKREAKGRSSQDLAQAIRDGELSEILHLGGELHPTTNAAVYSFQISRK